MQEKTIQIFNYGNCQRDFTYIDDIVEEYYPCYAKNHLNVKMVRGITFHPMLSTISVTNHPENLLNFVNILQQG